MTHIKDGLLQQCIDRVNSRLQTIQNSISLYQKALSSETKSSAGDKHETGRAMVQLEMEKAGQQLSSIQQMKEVLLKINPSNKSKVASLGAIIETPSISYFLSVSVGQLNFNGHHYYAISTSSPIGQQLLGKKKGDYLSWNGEKEIIQKVL